MSFTLQTPETFVRELLKGKNAHKYTIKDTRNLIDFLCILRNVQEKDVMVTDIILDDFSKFSNFPDGVREEIFRDIRMYYFCCESAKKIKITLGESSGSLVKSTNKR